MYNQIHGFELRKLDHSICSLVTHAYRNWCNIGSTTAMVPGTGYDVIVV